MGNGDCRGLILRWRVQIKYYLGNPKVFQNDALVNTQQINSKRNCFWKILLGHDIADPHWAHLQPLLLFRSEPESHLQKSSTRTYEVDLSTEL